MESNCFERQLSRAVEHSTASVVVTDAMGRIEYVNPGFASTTGYTAEEVIGRNPRLLQSGKHAPEFYSRMWSTILAGGNWRGEILNRRKNGELFWEQATISAVPDEHGRITHFIAVKEDITDRKRVEDQLLESNARLQQTNAQLERALAQARDLAIAADASNRAKSAFLASMSHELRTPLNAILGVASTLGADTAKDDLAQCSALIVESGNNLLGIIEEILDYSGLQAGKATLEAKPFELRGVVNHCLLLAEEMARPKGLEVSHRMGLNVPPTIVGDSRRIRQILLNLLANAVKFTDLGRVHLGISARALSGGTCRLVFTVSDTGVGISPEGITRLFQPFSRIRNELTAAASGTGLGLAISRSFAQMMGGDIIVRSRPNRGTTFRCAVTVGANGSEAGLLDDSPEPATTGKKPLTADGGRSLTSSRETPAAAEGSPGPDGGSQILGRRLPLRILAADDIKTNRDMLKLFLRKLGYGVVLVNDGSEVLAALREAAYDLVLLDVHMPVMDGLTTARTVIQLHPRASERPKLVALTANALPGDRETCLAAGMDDYLSKPVIPKDIETCFLRLFSKGQGAPAALQSQPAAAEAPCLDLAYFESVFPGLASGEDLAAVMEMQAAAADDYRRVRARLSEACAARDCAALAECAHALKGCFASLGWARTARLCAETVALARNGEFDQWDTWPGELEQCIAASREAMESHLASIAGFGSPVTA